MERPTPLPSHPSPFITLFGSSRPQSGEREYQTAYELGKLVAREGYTICNGGYGGTMEASARGAREAGGKTIGVVAEIFGRQANRFTDETILTRTHAERLMKLVELGDAYVVLKGSTGTLLELSTVWEYMNKGILQNRPIIIVGAFWTSVINTLEHELAWEGQTSAGRYVVTVDSPAECIACLRGHFDALPRQT